MKQKERRLFSPMTVTLLMVIFLSAAFLVNASFSLAGSTTTKGSPTEITTAVDYATNRIERLHAALKITADQKEPWDNLAAIMLENAKEMDERTKDRIVTPKPMNAVEEMKLHYEIFQINLEQQKKLIPVFEALYNSLSDQQKEIADVIFLTGRHGKYRF
ncbi:MAG: Spy/CpxP family protein refolding chaperone [Pseudomonadota bacterium]